MLPLTDVMNTRTHPGSESAPVLRWVFRREAHAITCELDIRGHRSYDVCTVPHWDVSSSVVEHFEATAPALLRHAQIARTLRETGWILTDHVYASGAAAAA
jgi:hypothetical protein